MSETCCPWCRQPYDYAAETGYKIEHEEVATGVWRDRCHCLQGHLLPKPNAILIGIFGPPGAGKDYLQTTMSRKIAESPLSTFGISVWAPPDERFHSRALIKPSIPKANEYGTEPKLGIYRIKYRGQESELWVYDTHGPDFIPGDPLSKFPFLSQLDVLVFAIPPPCLTWSKNEMSAALRAGPSDDPLQTSHLAHTAISNIVNALDQWEGGNVPKPRIAVVAMTKCDRYSGLAWRSYTRMCKANSRADVSLEDLANHCCDAGQFLISHGGQGYLQSLAEMPGCNGHVFVTAISSATGEPGLGEDNSDPELEIAASPDGEPASTLLPLRVALSLMGIGDYGDNDD